MNVLRIARREAGLSQAQLARRIAVTQPEIARLEAPGANPRLRTLERALQACGRRLELAPLRRSSIDESLVVERLKLSPGERIESFERSHADLATFAAAAARSRGGSG
jgi:predicted transcriptional regulator